MVFRRRNPLSFWKRLKNYFWPSAGWRRTLQYLWYRLARMRASPHAIAAGFACGVAISFTPFIGFHLILAAALSALVRGNVVAGFLGTIVGNPWTFPPIWIVTLTLGTSILGTSVDLSAVQSITQEQIIEAPYETLRNSLVPIIWPMTVGGVILGILSWWIVYLPLCWSIERFRARRRKIIRRKLRRKARDSK